MRMMKYVGRAAPFLLLGLMGEVSATTNLNEQDIRNLRLDNDKAISDIRDNLQAVRDIEDKMRQEAAKTLQATAPEAQTQSPSAAESEDLSESCLEYQKVTLTGVTLIDDAPFQAKLSGCISENSLNSLSREIVAAYIQKGYMHTQMDFIEHEDQTLEIAVIEGRIREITGGSRTVNTKMLFPNAQGKPLNVHFLEQGIEQANKLSSNDVTMDIFPHEDGTATVHLDNDQRKSWMGSFTVDNQGNKPNQEVGRLQLGIDSPFGLSDSLYISAYSNLRHGNGRHNQGGSLFYNVPYGAWTFSGYAGGSDSKNVIELARAGVKLNQTQRSTMAGVKAERLLSRSSTHFNSAYLGVDYVDVTSRFGGVRLALQSPTLSSVQGGVTHSKVMDNGVWMTDIGVEVGTKLFGAKQDDKSPFDNQYVRFSLQSDFSQSRRFGLWLVRNRHKLTAQYGNEPLYALKKFSISDRHTVRGFDGASASGDSGVAFNNTLYARRYLTNGLYFEPYVGADIGMVKDNSARYVGTGLAAGLNLGYKQYAQLSVESAHGLMRDKDNKTRDSQVSLSAKVMF